MRKSRFTVFSAGVYLLLILVVGCAKKDPVLVQIDGKAEIRLSEFETSFSKNKKPEDIARAGEDKYMDHLGRMIDDRVKLMLAFKKGYDQDSTVLVQIDNIRQHLLLRKLHENEVIDRVIPEKDIRDAYAKKEKEIIASHIYFRLSPRATAEQEQSVREKAEQVLSRVRGGEDFANRHELSNMEGPNLDVGTVSIALQFADKNIERFRKREQEDSARREAKKASRPGGGFELSFPPANRG